MLINVGNLPQNGSNVELHLKKAEVSIRELKGDAVLSVKVIKSGNSYDVEGFIEYDLLLECSRCLGEIIRQERRSFHLEVKEKKSGTIDGKYTREEDESEILYNIENNCINLGPFIRDEIILSIPMKPLCDEECKGLCVICGADLNKSTCRHSKNKEKSLT